MGNLQVRLCDQERLARSVGYKPTEVKVRSLVALDSGEEGNRISEAYRQNHLQDGEQVIGP